MARPFTSPTLIDVGRAVGVSAATASMALRGDPRISAATRTKIRQAARKLGYVPDPMLAALVARRDRSHQRQTFANIAGLIDDRWLPCTTKWLENLTNGMHRACSRLGYTLDLINIQKDLLTTPRPDRILTGRGVRGVIILPLYSQGLTIPLDWKRYSVLSIGTPVDKLPVHRVASDAFAAMSLACSKLRELGYLRIGLVNIFDNEQRMRFEWLGSYCKESVINLGFTTVPPFLPSSFTLDAFQHWLETHEPECIITNDYYAYRFLLELGWKIPRDIGIAALGRNNPDMEHLTGISQHLDASGETSVEHLHTMLLKGETGLPEIPREIMISPHWYNGDTTRRIRRQK